MPAIAEKTADAAKANVNTAAEAATSTLNAQAAAAQTAASAGQKAWQDGMSRATAFGGTAFKDAADKSLNALNEMNTQSKRNLEAFVASMTAATKGAETLGSNAMAYAKSSMEGQVEAARTLSTARSLQEVIELQTAYAKSAMETYVSELNRASEVVTTTVKDTFKPLSERATAVMETVQAAR